MGFGRVYTPDIAGKERIEDYFLSGSFVLPDAHCTVHIPYGIVRECRCVQGRDSSSKCCRNGKRHERLSKSAGFMSVDS